MRVTIDFNCQESICKSCANYCAIDTKKNFSYCSKDQVEFREIPLDKVYDCSEYQNIYGISDYGTCSWVDRIQNLVEDIEELSEENTNENSDIYSYDTKAIQRFQEDIKNKKISDSVIEALDYVENNIIWNTLE